MRSLLLRILFTNAAFLFLFFSAECIRAEDTAVRAVSEPEKNADKISKKKMDLDKEFMQSAKVIVRVHILEVFNLINLESENVPNPYLKVCLGTEEKDVIQLLNNFY